MVKISSIRGLHHYALGFKDKGIRKLKFEVSNFNSFVFWLGMKMCVRRYDVSDPWQDLDILQ